MNKSALLAVAAAVALMMVVVLPASGLDKKLPRVLIIGDTVYTQHARGLDKPLQGRAAVEMADFPREAVLNSSAALDHLDRMLGLVDGKGEPVPEDRRPTWDLIHINVGLGDLIHRVPKMDTFRVLPIDAGGVVATKPEAYRANLDRLITRLKATGAKVVWASTTPIRASRNNVFRLGSEIEYNAIAAEVMARHDVPINDMYGYTRALMNMDKPAGHGADPFNFDKKQIHMPIVRVVERAFGLKPVPETEEEKEVKAQSKPVGTS